MQWKQPRRLRTQNPTVGSTRRNSSQQQGSITGTLFAGAGRGWSSKPINPRLGFAIGTASYYPPIAVPMIKRLDELRQKTRNPDEWLWRLWLEDFPADILLWTDERLAAEQKKLAPIRNDRDLETVIAGIPAPG